MSIRRTCRVLEVDTLSYHYKSRRPEQAVLKGRIKEIRQTRVRYGYRRVQVLLRREGWRINHKKTYRIYREMGLHDPVPRDASLPVAAIVLGRNVAYHSCHRIPAFAWPAHAPANPVHAQPSSISLLKPLHRSDQAMPTCCIRMRCDTARNLRLNFTSRQALLRHG